MRPIKQLQMGKNGLSDAFISQVRTLLEVENLVKISILKSLCRDKKEAEAIGQRLVDALGKNFDFRLIGYVLTVRKFRKAVR